MNPYAGTLFLVKHMSFKYQYLSYDKPKYIIVVVLLALP